MDDPATSHPFYWSGFATIGDGTAPVIRKPQNIAALTNKLLRSGGASACSSGGWPRRSGSW